METKMLQMYLNNTQFSGDVLIFVIRAILSVSMIALLIWLYKRIKCYFETKSIGWGGLVVFGIFVYSYSLRSDIQYEVSIKLLLITLFVIFVIISGLLCLGKLGRLSKSFCILALLVITTLFMLGLSNVNIQNNVIFLLELSIIMSVILIIFGVSKKYQCVVSKMSQVEADIIKRKNIIRLLSYLIAFIIAAIPFLFLFEQPNLNMSEYSILQFIERGMRFSLICTVFVLLSDNIIKRLTQEILIYDDVRDLEKFCLYLRSFSTEKNKEERFLCGVVKGLYPVYAIGDPNKVLQPNGAERVYVTDKVWQDAVKELSSKSKLILLRIGLTDGTKWEIANVFDSQLIEKTIFIAYNQTDYAFFAQKVKDKYGFIMPEISFASEKPVAIFFYNDINGLMYDYYEIATAKDVENMINEYLKVSPQLDAEYSKDLDLRHHNLKYMFNKERIPAKVRRSLNWGIISPIVNMRHWPITMWVALILMGILSLIIGSYVPVYVFCLFAFIFGNRIEWTTRCWSSASQFLKHQRREARLMWLSIVFGLVHSVLYIYVTYMVH